MSQPLTRPFTSDHSQIVRAPDGRNWTITIQRGNAWQPWPWFEAFSTATQTAGDTLVGTLVLLPLPALLAAPAVLGRWVVYKLRRRTDWRVTVRLGSHYSGARRGAVLDELHQHKAAAAARAEELRGRYQAGAVPAG
jgi:hypothetical protein